MLMRDAFTLARHKQKIQSDLAELLSYGLVSMDNFLTLSS